MQYFGGKARIAKEIVSVLNKYREEDYENAKITTDKKLKAFIGIGCSYSGKWFGGYARGQKGRNYAKNAKNSLLKKFKTLGKVDFISKSYDKIDCKDALIYCDPPYNETTKYKFGKFDSNKFWQWCRDMSKKGNTVIVSEYNAPNDFKCIWSKETKTDIRTKQNGKETRIEKLFIAS